MHVTPLVWWLTIGLTTALLIFDVFVVGRRPMMTTSNSRTAEVMPMVSHHTRGDTSISFPPDWDAARRQAPCSYCGSGGLFRHFFVADDPGPGYPFCSGPTVMTRTSRRNTPLQRGGVSQKEGLLTKPVGSAPVNRR